MMYHLMADLILIIHLAFVLFVLFGGLLVLKWRWIAWLHLPAATWGAVVECTGWICPLTPLEHWLRSQTGGTSSPSDSLVQYLLPALYPSGLTREIQILLGMLVLGVNLAIYGWLWRRTSVKTTRSAQ
ncbi:MAG: DUF2784 domain-containing protein [Nitrospira sp.]|nr:DUF2784 domain-containing protein [Nitrospira sp.]MBP0126979.1 DUF2784 domain-containing protein [Nitrospira sp.]MBP0129889.1 DUF2784 domain-containing protein [Nitrospira sp.]MBP0130141.1 DUF2784 domain-containing protein [Nitrospira sp.]